MCKRKAIEALVTKAIKAVDVRVSNPIERMVALKIIAEGIKEELESKDFQAKANALYDKTNPTEMLECPLKKASVKSTWEYSTNIKKMEVDLKAARQIEQIEGKATKKEGTPKFKFSPTIKTKK